jgi:hypothetical protein
MRRWHGRQLLGSILGVIHGQVVSHGLTKKPHKSTFRILDDGGLRLGGRCRGV